MSFANWFRLYRLTMGLIDIQHIDYCQWSFEGCYYSQKPSTPWWLETNLINCLMDCEDPIDFMKRTIRERVASFIYHPSNHKELIICWMTIKTLQAEKTEKLVSFWNDRAISAYINIEDNYIVPMKDFHWGNLYCGYSYSYTHCCPVKT